MWWGGRTTPSPTVRGAADLSEISFACSIEHRCVIMPEVFGIPFCMAERVRLSVSVERETKETRRDRERLLPLLALILFIVRFDERCR